MPTQTRSVTRFSTVTVEGAILPADLLGRIAERDKALEGLSPESYDLAGERLNEAITRAWNRARALWAGFREARAQLPREDAGMRPTREKWLLQLFKTLDYGLLSPAQPLELDGKLYAVSHLWQHTLIHLVGCGQELDTRIATVEGAPRMSPHGLVQELLNRSRAYLWAFVSNGLRLRILRDSASLTRQAFVEFDLEAMFEGEAYPDFALLWMLCHATRVRADRPEDCWLERWSRAAQAQGTRALDQLRQGVENAIQALGAGFLHAQANRVLKDELARGTLSRYDYFRQLQRLTYRLIFLFVAEDRDVLLRPDAAPEVRERYQRHYSTQRLRRLAQTVKGTPHGDLWRALSRMMAKLGEDTGCPELGLPVLGSFLWSERAVGMLGRCELSNRALLDAVRALSFTEEKGTRRLVDWRNMGSEELGSVYESLLELQPDLNVREGVFTLKSVSGNERKTSGSYYTPTSLVSCLLDSALEPVLEEALRQPDPEKAILRLKVVDPACGSGHFLTAAAHRMAKRLAGVRTGNEEPAPRDVRRALRDVIGHCIHGVDVNEMAVELCKVSLWMEALDPGRPLSFLDSKIRVGNALIGATPRLVAGGIPDAAFTAIEGDDKKVVSALKKRNKAERDGQESLFAGGLPGVMPRELTERAGKVEALADDVISGVHSKEEGLRALEGSAEYQRALLEADLWCAAFVARKVTLAQALTTETLRRAAENPGSLPAAVRAEIERLRTHYRFFHWHLGFPDVCRAPGAGEEGNAQGWVGGFDVVLGNPPWETTELKEKEWFAVHRPDIAEAGNAAERKKKIADLEHEEPVMYAAFLEASRHADAERHFLSKSGRYPLCGVGRVNTYAVFAEWNRALVNPQGRCGCIVPSGIATDDSTKEFFQALIEAQSLVSLLSFENEERVFEAVHHAIKFCLLTIAHEGRGAVRPAFAFFARQVEQALDPERQFTLGAEDIRLLNPNTRTCPTFRSARDAEIAKKVYARLPILVKEGESEENPWGVRMKQGLFNMASDSDMFIERAMLETDGWHLEGNVFAKAQGCYLPLYEAKMVHHFDHRWGTYEGQTQAQSNQGILPRLTPEQRADPNFVALPWFWVPEREVNAALADIWSRRWLLGWRDIVRSTDERTVIAAFIPRVGVGHTFPLLMPRVEPVALCAGLIASLSTLIFDYFARLKVGGTHLTFTVVNQLPVVPPTAFSGSLPWLTGDAPTVDWFASRVLELTYTARDMEGFARDLGYEGPPFRWDEERRVQMRAELDAAFLHLYGLDRSDSEHVIESFPVLRKNEEFRLGEFRTRRLVLMAYDAMTEAMKRGTRYVSPLGELSFVKHVA